MTERFGTRAAILSCPPESRSASRVHPWLALRLSSIAAMLICWASLANPANASDLAAGQAAARESVRRGADSLLVSWLRSARVRERQRDSTSSPRAMSAWLTRMIPDSLILRGIATHDSMRRAQAAAIVESLRVALEKEDDERTAWTGTVKAGLNGDEAAGKSHYEVPTNVTIGKGLYPNELRFVAETDITIDHANTTEDVTSLLANFDHHLRPWLETYAFVERFTDNFMAIGRRYEAGIGFRLGRGFGAPLLETSQKESGIYDFPAREVLKSREQRKGDPAPGEPVSAPVEAFLDRIVLAQEAIAEYKSPLFVGLAFSAFQELEEARPSVMDSVSGKEKEVNLPGEHQIRWVVRPSLLLNVSTALAWSTEWYFKFGESPKDLRVDGVVRGKLNMGAESGLKEVAIVAEYRVMRDTRPPRASKAEMAKAGAVIAEPEFVAPNRHESVRLGIEIGI